MELLSFLLQLKRLRENTVRKKNIYMSSNFVSLYNSISTIFVLTHARTDAINQRPSDARFASTKTCQSTCISCSLSLSLSSVTQRLFSQRWTRILPPRMSQGDKGGVFFCGANEFSRQTTAVAASAVVAFFSSTCWYVLLLVGHNFPSSWWCRSSRPNTHWNTPIPDSKCREMMGNLIVESLETNKIRADFRI